MSFTTNKNHISASNLPKTIQGKKKKSNMHVLHVLPEPIIQRYSYLKMKIQYSKWELIRIRIRTNSALHLWFIIGDSLLPF